VTSVADEGYARIRGDIIFGRLKPSQRLRLEVLRQEYVLSVTTLREILSEILNRLTSERLVVAEGQRGFEVAPISIENLKELVDLRLLLESHAIDQSFALATLNGRNESYRPITSSPRQESLSGPLE
jgi:DNA-binding GntR family transcriptional regulator